MTTNTQTIIDRHDRYMSINYGRYPVAFVRGHGSTLFDAEGKQYLDLFAGFGGPILGHCHPDLVKAVTEQASKLWHVGNLFHTEPQTRLAEAIHRHGFSGRSFFCHSGADANEAAIKLARLYGQARPGPQGHRYRIVTATQSFHGRTFGTMVATGQEKVRHGFEPLLAGFSHVPYNDVSAMRGAVDGQTIAIMVEPIQGEGGVIVPDENYLRALRTLCDEHDLLLICDEVWTGCGRTGKWFAHQHWDIQPDIMTLAKGVGGGLAVGVMCAKDHVAQLYDYRKYGGAIHATTLGGNCLSMAVSATIFDVIERDNLLDHARTLGRHAMDRLSRFAKKQPGVKNVRGKGLFVGIELAGEAKAVVDKCLQRGVIIAAAQKNIVRLAPPLVVTLAELDHGLDILEQAIAG